MARGPVARRDRPPPFPASPLLPREKSAAVPDDPPLLIGPNGHAGSILRCCPTSTTATAYSQALARTVLISVGCRRWSCSFCGRLRVAALSKRVEAAKPTRLITLTVDPKLWESPRHAYDGTRRALGPWTRDMRREGQFEYLRVLELTKAGWPHYHLLVRSGYRHYAQVRASWQANTGARIVDVRQVRKRDSVYWYLTKYLAKQSACEFTDRKLSQTRGFFPPKVPYRDLELVGFEREMQSVPRWLDCKGGDWYLRPLGPYMWAVGAEPLEDQGEATPVAFS